MDDVDIKTIEITCTKAKLRYDEMDVAFGDKIAGLNIFVPINLTSVIIDLGMFKESLIDASDFEIHAAISILNIFAHYKHFFQTKNVNHVVIVGYVKDNWIYNKYKNILDQVVDYCEFFPNVYMIPKVLLDNRLYIHLVSAVLNHMKMVMPTKHQSGMFVVSNNSVDRQLMCLFPTKCAYTMFKNCMRKTEIIEKTSYMRSVLIDSKYYDNSPNKSQLEQMNILLGGYFGYLKSYMKRIRKNDNIRLKYLHTKTADKNTVLTSFLKESYDQNSPDSASSQFLDYLMKSNEFADKNTMSVFAIFERIYDFRYQNIGELNNMIIPMMNAWRKKIKDYALARESEAYKTLISHQLFSNWLC